MGAYNPLPVEVVKYLKFPDRRLISGFLSINCVSHDDNDALDDAQQEYYDNWDSSSPSNNANSLQNAVPFEGVRPDDPSRANYKHTFGDYDCLLFWVAGGMTLQSPNFTGSTLSQAQLAAKNFIHDASGSTTWEDDAGSPNDNYVDGDRWYTGVTHSCQHFLKSHLISRINNGHGFTATDYSRVTPIRQDTFELDDDSAASKKEDGTGAPTAYASNRKGQWSRYVLSNGIFSNDNDGNYIVDLSTDTNNTYFPMIEGVEIYGKHDFTIPTHFSTDVDGSGTDGYVYTSSNTSVGNYSHQDDFWSMVVKIK